jgi:glycosyltransferase involved in cell wall biosynthesis
MLGRLVARTDRDRFRSVVVGMTKGGTAGGAIDSAGVEVKTLGIPRGMPDPRGLFRLSRILRQAQPDILHTWLYHADLLGLVVRQLGHVPHLLWNIRCSESIGSAGVRRVLSRFSAVPDRVIINSSSGRRFHERIGYHPRRWEHIPNGFDTAAFRPDAVARRRVRAALGIEDADIVIGLAARVHPMKDHRTFLGAAAMLAAKRSEPLFLLVGTGTEPSSRELGSAIQAHGLAARVRLLGERGDMEAIYPALDIAASSSAFGEGFPNVLGEAMACGVPCVATDSGDTPQLLGDAGLVVPRRNPEALAAAWETLISLGAEGRQALGRKGRARIVRDYELGSVVARYEALYDDVAAQGSASRAGPASPSALRPGAA